MALENLQYPIGKFIAPAFISDAQKNEWISILENFPNKLDNLVAHLTDEQLNTPYREGGWTIRQVVHHCSDSHHHSYIRFKWALTEDSPVIKAYEEKDWAELFDTQSAPIAQSILHLKAVHAKLVYLLKGLTESQLNRHFIHPSDNSKVVLKENIGIYAWHSNHHYAHIEHLLIRKGWK
ncbi:MAG: putative metal-dependent hydrolase [Flavobacteriaceae bacterium]